MNITPSYLNTGVADLDIDSDALLGFINEAIRCTEPARIHGLKPSLAVLDTALKARFEREDKLMADCCYRWAAHHCGENQRLLAEINFQIVELHGGLTHPAFIGRFLKNWLLPHVVETDVELGEAIVAQEGTIDRRHETTVYGGESANDLYTDRRIGVRDPIVWTDEMAIGVESIDQEHLELVRVFNAIIVCSKSGDRDEISRLLNQLGHATGEHFEQEEALMAKNSYQNLAPHQIDHRKLLEEFSHLLDDWLRGRHTAEFLCRFLYRWLLRHIVTFDRPFGATLKS